MDRPLKLVFRNIIASVELKTLIRRCMMRLEQRHDHITGCSVTVELQNHKHGTGHIPNVNVDVQVPGETLLIRNQNGRGDDVLMAVRHAFDSAVRQVEEYKARRKARMELCESVGAVKE